jgi:hypothetical protein
VFVDLCLMNAYRRRKLEGARVVASHRMAANDWQAARAALLQEMEQVVPWRRLRALLNLFMVRRKLLRLGMSGRCSIAGGLCGAGLGSSFPWSLRTFAHYDVTVRLWVGRRILYRLPMLS